MNQVDRNMMSKLFAVVLLLCYTFGYVGARLFDEFPAHGPWIVEFDSTVQFSTISTILQTTYDTIGDLSIPFNITHQWQLALYGVALYGLTQPQLESIVGVTNVYPDLDLNITAYSWGTDRIDQESGTNGVYNPAYSGLNSDVYVLDTGVDCDHVEFAANQYGRTCENIYNAYGSTSSNTDGQGHGTHCAGTVGGNTIGVAKGANIYGMKVLSDSGSGSTVNIIDAMNIVISRHVSSIFPRSVISMSLGGNCANDYCENDPSMAAVQNCINAGITVSIAAGNSGCNACFTSPAAAPNAITVGATTRSDDQAFFSNSGQCIDVWAPGSGIVSACSSKTSNCAGSETSYISLSGTSMACPHASGVAAQLYEKYGASTSPEDIMSAMTCDGVLSTLDLNAKDTLSKNLLLQTPKNDGAAAGSCTPGDGCTNDCSGKGVCHPAHTSSSQGSTENICHCDGGYYGDRCQSTDGNNYPSVGSCGVLEMSLTLTMTGNVGSFGGWNYKTFSLTDVDDKIVQGYAYDSFCTLSRSNSDTRTYCLPQGEYLMRTGDYDDLGFELCDKTGGGDFEGTLIISSTVGGLECSWIEPPTAMPTEFPTAVISFIFYAQNTLTSISEDDFTSDEALNKATVAAAIQSFVDYEATTVTVLSVSASSTTKNRRFQTKEDTIRVVYEVDVSNAREAGFDSAESAYNVMRLNLETATPSQITDEIQSEAQSRGAQNLNDVSGDAIQVNDADFPTVAPTDGPGSSSSSTGFPIDLTTENLIIIGAILAVCAACCGIMTARARKPSSEQRMPHSPRSPHKDKPDTGDEVALKFTGQTLPHGVKQPVHPVSPVMPEA